MLLFYYQVNFQLYLTLSHSDTNLSIFNNKILAKFTCLFALRITCTRNPNHLCKNSNHLGLYTHSNINLYSIFALIYIRFVSFTQGIKWNTFTFIFFTLFGTKTRAYGSSIVLQLPPHIVTIVVNVYKRISSEFISTNIGLAWHGWLLRDIHFVCLFELEKLLTH